MPTWWAERRLLGPSTTCWTDERSPKYINLWRICLGVGIANGEASEHVGGKGVMVALWRKLGPVSAVSHDGMTR